MYASCGATTYAHKLFGIIPHSHKDTVDWTTLMNCFAHHGMLNTAINLFSEMRKEGVRVDDVTIIVLFEACARLGNVAVGVQAHGSMVKMGLGFTVKACNAVMDMYGKCGLMGEARQVFEEMKEKSVVSWTVILDGVVKWEGVGSGMVVFSEMPDKNEVAWTIMIAAHIGSGFTKEGFTLLSEMVLGSGFGLNKVTFCSILSACAQSGDVVMGRWVHVRVLKAMGREMDVKVGTALVDMYAKSGRIDTAFKVFEYMPQKNVVAWNAMLNGLGMHGRGKAVVDMFPKMMEEAKPDDLTLMAVLNACSHTGLVDQGCHYFYNLESVYGLTPKIEHYACMVDILGRAGRLEEAEMLIKKMPIPPNEVVFGSLLASCSVHGKFEQGEGILKELIQMDPLNTEYHILLSNMYALAGKRYKATCLRQVLKLRGIRKVPGMSCIHVGGQVHQFSSGDKMHPQTQEIYIKLDEMIQKLRSAGYVPNTTFQVFSGCDGGEVNADEMEEREQAVFSHSEKLAVCFGLISTRANASLYIFKNLRICQDCHSAIKIVSKIYNREIVIRDRNRFHCFRQGLCSCSDYW
ncbi:PPR domain-containing protein/PPR_2 domain-containing protein/PPR_3 domain-containing protein/DYW_deaminase domain-containing protein [Cephalotus follicularis]|uniref:PPR domain-containing protein/PPR_2 domain-containing protein/PPR_3 domain-containing protein/DYW_deaminase domain-containing protein n=1 Tax=Cephalotus follicularis TaxID=3775 RepID=A0A1Q3CBW2_CEPFO|nr:PPR domain-containing protein/PPR_2 domain-containing protein/PPR_3 domain-containing protein/DYW_deaminase domain-containing protein [Cephalotus follicularis]